MNKLDEFKAKYLDVLELENKDEILSAFGEVKNVFNDTIESRNKTKTKLEESETFKKSIAELMEFDSEFTVDDIKTKLNEKQGDVAKIREELSAKYDEKYSKDIKTLNDKLAETENSKNDLLSTYNDTLLKHSVTSTEEFKKIFVNDKDAIDSIILPKVKPHLLFKDGQVFVRDDITGDIATGFDGKPKNPLDIIQKVASEVSPIYLNRQTTGDGMGTQQSINPTAPTAPDTSKYKDANSFMGDAFKSIKG